jgi:hypothetical protein
MYFSDFIYNKSKDKSIVLIHGAYGSAGYWLPYLHFFDNYKIIVLNMDFSKILNKNEDLIIAKILLQKYQTENNVVAIVAHSLGTIFSNIISNRKNIFIFNICPVAYSKRVNIEKFKVELRAKLNSKNTNIKTSPHLIKNLIEESTRYITNELFYYIPYMDDYFIYDFPQNVHLFKFNGNHFDIQNSIFEISSKLNQIYE